MFHAVLYDTDKRIISQMDYFFKIHAKNFQLTIFSQEEDLIQSITNHNHYDLILIGIGLTNSNGIQIAKQIRNLEIDSHIVFISNLECYYYDAFEVEPFRFFKKPIDWKLFFNMLQVLQERLDNNNKYFYFKKENVIHKIRFDDILYFESRRRVVNVITCHDTFSYYDKLDSVEDYIREKNNYFIRIHKSFLVNSKHISQFEYTKVHLNNETTLPISENKRISIRDKYMDYIGGFVCGRSKTS